MVWNRTLGGMVTSSAAVVNGIIYIGAWETSGVLGKLHALNLTTGSPVWTYTAGANGIPSSPAVDGGRVFVGTRNNNIVALDAQTGSEKWNISIGGAVYASPAVSNGAVYVPALDSKVYARDAISGAKKWETMLSYYSESSPAVANGKVYLGNEAGFVYALYESNGSIAWTYDTKAKSVPSSPSIHGGNVFISNSKQMIVYALNANTGAKVWERNVSGGATLNGIYSSAAVHNGVVFVTTKNGAIYALNESSGSVVWNKPISSKFISSSPTISDGKIIFGGDEGFLYVLDEATGDLVWKYETMAVMTSSPAVCNGYILIGGKDHMLYAFGHDKIPPTVADTNPKNSATNVPVTAKIWVKFSEGMDSASGAGAFSISPNVPFNITWDAGNMTATLERNASLSGSTLYTVTVKGTISDLHSNQLGNDYTFGFTTQNTVTPTIISTSIKDKQQNVSLTATFEVEFSKPMDRLQTEQALSFSPGVFGIYSWSNADKNMTFTPNSPGFADNTQHTATIAGTARDKSGIDMGSPYAITFHTVHIKGPEVVSTAPKNGETNIKVTATIVITFNEPIDETSAKNGFSIAPTVSISSITASGKVMTVKPASLLGATKYTVTISNVKDLSGNKMSSPYSFWFMTSDATSPYVNSTTPKGGATGVDTGTTSITVVFSEEMDKASVESAMTIYPGVQFMTKWDNASPAVIMMLGTILAECTRYLVNISTGAKDISGNPLVSLYTLSFTTKGECKQKPPPPPENPIIDMIFKYWWLLLLIFIIIMIIAIAIPGRKTLAMYYGVDEDDIDKKDRGR